jgi:hypothetical protein
MFTMENRTADTRVLCAPAVVLFGLMSAVVISPGLDPGLAYRQR